MVADHFERDAVSLLRVADSVVQEKPTSIPAVVTQAGFVRDQIERVLAWVQSENDIEVLPELLQEAVNLASKIRRFAGAEGFLELLFPQPHVFSTNREEIERLAEATAFV